MKHPIPRTLALLLAFALGCAEPQAPPAPRHRAVVAPAIHELERELAAERAAGAADAGPATLEPDHARGLIEMLARAGPRERELPLEEVGLAGEAAVGPLLELLRADSLGAPERAAAVELLARAGGERAARFLLELASSAPEAWLRSHAAWQLGASGVDALLPDFVLRLKYETDPEVRVWLCRGLARLGSLAGVPLLRELRDDPGTPEAARSLAGAELERLAHELGFGDGEALHQVRELADLDARLPRVEPSPALRLETWRRIAMLSGEHFQLRGVDDARYVLARLEGWAVPLLAAALEEDDVWLRVHVAQCLERMGPRAVEAGPALLAALADPSLAPQAARALGELAWSPAAAALLPHLRAEGDHELRVASARALGRLAAGPARTRLEQLVTDAGEPVDLRQAAAEALVEMGVGEGAVPFLLRCLTDPAADRDAAEGALGQWLAARSDDAARAAHATWIELGRSDTYPAPTRAEVEARLRGRIELLTRELPHLIGARR